MNTIKGKQTTLLARSDPKVDETDLLGEGEHGHNAYQKLISSFQCLCYIGQADMKLAVH